MLINIHQKTSIKMFTASIFVKAKNWTQTKHPLTVGRINKLEYAHT